jgi:predicted Rossmann fold nucleotide-binding protein DprA/Smf involved in DNA uptake
MQKLLQQIQKKRADEQKTLDRLADEVTIDAREVSAEFREKAFSEVEELAKKAIKRMYEAYPELLYSRPL